MNLNKIVFRFVSISFSILVLLLVLVGLFRIGTYCYDFGYRVFTEAPMDEAPGRDVVVQVTDDMSGMDIGKLLEDKGLVADSRLFYAQLKVSAYSSKLNSGIYTLNTSMTAKEMMVIMAAEPEVSSEAGSGSDEVEGVIDDTEATEEDTEEDTTQGE